MNSIYFQLQAILILGFLFIFNISHAQYEDFHTVKAKIDFNNLLREWDGFGVNYAQTAHTRDYGTFPQEYGGFSLLEEKEKLELDPQQEPDMNFTLKILEYEAPSRSVTTFCGIKQKGF